MSSFLIEEDVIAKELLNQLHANDSSDMVKAVVAWMRQESGNHIVRNNPWNISELVRDGHALPRDGGFVEFSSLDDGIKGTAYLLQFYPPSDFRGYAQIVEAAQKDDAQGFLAALANSKWDAAHYGTLTGGANHLVGVFDSIKGYVQDTVTPGPLDVVTPAPTPAEPTPPDSPVQPDDPNTYVVQPGDTLWGIAVRFLGDGRLFPEIAQLNNIKNPSLIHPGEVIFLPALENRKPIPTPEGHYTVQPGDTLWGIAEHELGNGTLWLKLYALNRGVIGENPNLIHPGQVLKLPE